MALWSGGTCVASILFLMTTMASGAIGASNGRVVCYYSSWAHYRNGLAKYTVEDIPVELCTHLIYAFATMDSKTFLMKPFDPWLDIDLKNYEKFVQLKKKNPKMKVLVGVGGWNDSRTTKYSRMVADAGLRRKFVEQAVEFLLQYGFDGLDLDWEYPGYESRREDKEGFTHWVEDLKTALAPRGLLLTSAVSAGRRTIDRGYDIPKIAKHLDFINLMAYDFHGSWERAVAHHSPLYPESGQNPEFNADFAVNYWIRKGAPADKIVLGVPFYGRSWTLSGSANYPGSSANGPGKRGKYVKEAGHLAYYECCLAHQEDGWAKINGEGGPYLTKGNQWVGYDDIDAVVKKADYARNKGLGGIMVWDLVSDDFNNACGHGHNPLLTAISQTLKGNPPPPTQTPSFPTTPPPEPSTSSRSTIWSRGNSGSFASSGSGSAFGGSSGSTFGGSSQTGDLPYDWLAWPIFGGSGQDPGNSISSDSGSSSFVTPPSTSSTTRFQSAFSSRFTPKPIKNANGGSTGFGSGSSQTTSTPYDWLSWPIFNQSPQDTQNSISSNNFGSSSFVTTPPTTSSTSFQSSFISRFSSKPAVTTNNKGSTGFGVITNNKGSTGFGVTTNNKGSTGFGSGSSQTTKPPYEWLSWPIFNQSPGDSQNSISSFTSRTTSSPPRSSSSFSQFSPSSGSRFSSSSSGSLWFADCKSAGFAPDPTSCSAFYRCTDSYAYRFDCPGGLMWHQDQSSCDWPNVVQCVLPLSKPNIDIFRPPETSFV